MTAKRKYYPGDLRKAGEKEYAVILSKLIGYTKQLEKEQKKESILKLVNKITEKLTELGFKRESNKVKSLIKNVITSDKYKLNIIEIAYSAWDDGIDKHKNTKAQK